MALQATLRIGTRGSPLALAQANMVRDQLIAAHGDLGDGDVELVIIKTSGDKIVDRPLADLGSREQLLNRLGGRVRGRVA